VRSFLVTHVHRDHYTQAVVLRREFGSRICLGADERASLRLAAEPGLSPIAAQLRVLHQAGAGDLARQIAAVTGGEAGDPGLWADPDEWITGGSTLAAGHRALEVIATPGTPSATSCSGTRPHPDRRCGRPRRQHRAGRRPDAAVDPPRAGAG
jgi:glyoxylase-like metal-dependent hydrolase (beta-lactamase superfamily II)